MEFSIAHIGEMNVVGQGLWPDGRVPWHDAAPPDLTDITGHSWTGRLRSCGYCGSMHPADVAQAIQVGAHGEWATMKYGWPHKSYFEGIPNPHAGLLESRGSANFQPTDERRKDWIKVEDHWWREPGAPASEKTDGKFYTVHLMDATPEERAIIENHLGLTFTFTDDGKVAWKKVEANP